MTNAYDAIAIGAGLTAAALYAQAGHRVLVLERHDQYGGAAITYRHAPLTIEGSLHQAADVGFHWTLPPRNHTPTRARRLPAALLRAARLGGSTKNAVNLLNSSAARHRRTTIRSHEGKRRLPVGKLAVTVSSVNRADTGGRQGEVATAVQLRMPLVHSGISQDVPRLHADRHPNDGLLHAHHSPG